MKEWTEDDMNEGGFDVVKPGRYWAEVKEVTQKKTKANNDDMWSIRFKDALTPNDTLCFDNLVFSKKGSGYAFKKLSRLGVEKVNGKYQVGHPDELIGRRCYLHIVNEQEVDSQGNKQINSDGSPKLKAVPDFKFDGFGYELDTGNQGEQASVPVASGNGTSDDIPF